MNENNDKEQYFLYFGRLSREKGIMTLIRAMEGTKRQLYIMGSGPCKEEIEVYLAEHNLTEQIKMLGFKSGQDLVDVVGNAGAVILPSEWYENGPYSAIESLQLGRPIIGSDLGGIPELIDGNGYIFRHGDVEQLRQLILNFPQSGTDEYLALCAASERIFQDRYMSEKHYEKLMKVYQEAIEAKKKV